MDKDEALFDGIKPWMRNAVTDWLEGELIWKNGGTAHYQVNAITDIELFGRINLGVQKYDAWRYQALIKLVESNEDYALDVVQAYIETGTVTEGYQYKGHRVRLLSISSLNSILIRGGSKWQVTVDQTKAKLEARVDEATENAYKKLSQPEDDYAMQLKQAWSFCYGRNPKPSEAYTYAVKAVEAVSWRLVTPKNSSATLGTILVDLEAKNVSGKVTTIFHDKKSGTSVEMVLQNMRRLWQGHGDRHATGAYVEPTQIEAEVAVHLAILICYLFTAKTVTVA